MLYACAGWSLSGPCLVDAIISSSQLCKAAIASTAAALHAVCRSHCELGLIWLCALAEQNGVSASPRGLSYWLATLLAGTLSYHWRLGLLLLPLAIACGACVLFWQLPNQTHFHTLLPVKLAGLQVSLYCSLLALVSCATTISSAYIATALPAVWWQWLIGVLPALTRLLLATITAQAVSQVWEPGVASEHEARFALLSLRLWVLVAASCVGGFRAALWCCAWLQKAYMAHQCAALVRCLRTLLRKHCGSDAAGEGTTHPLDAHCHSLQLLLLLALLLFVPPAAAASLPWLSWVVYGLGVWTFRVFACGYAMRITAQVLAASAGSTPTAGGVAMSVMLQGGVLLQLLREYWLVLLPIAVAVVGDNCLCAALPAARGALEAGVQGLMLAALGVETGVATWHEVSRLKQLWAHVTGGPYTLNLVGSHTVNINEGKLVIH